MDDTIIFLLDRSLSHLEKAGSNVRIMVFDFSSAWNTIQPALLGDKLELTGLNQHLTSWILDYLTNQPQYVRTQNCVSDTAAVQGPNREQSWILSCSPCTLQTSPINHLTAIYISPLTTLSPASSGTETTEPTESSLRTLWTGASGTNSSSMPRGPKS